MLQFFACLFFVAEATAFKSINIYLKRKFHPKILKVFYCRSWIIGTSTHNNNEYIFSVQ